MAQMRKEAAGDYQIGIWSVTRQAGSWLAVATGSGTLGDGSPHNYPTLAAAHLALTGERMPGDRTDNRPIRDRRRSRMLARLAR